MKSINEINPYIFRGYDIRGVYPETINEDTAYTVGKAYGSYIQELGKRCCIIGHDNRFSSESLTDALIKGILETGVNVTFLGLVTTPMYYYAAIKLGIPSGIMVTASHNPKDDNGFKIAFDERGNARGEMITDFYKYTIKGDFKEETGTKDHYNIRKEYITLMKKSLTFGKRKPKVVIDLGNGTTSTIAQELYKEFPVDLTVLFGDSDPSFPNHHPDPCVEKNLETLKQKVRELDADVGIGFDGDGDRLGVVDEKGNYVAIDQYMIIIIRNIIYKVENKSFLYDVKCSKSLEDEILKLGGTPFCYRTGNSYTKAKVAEMNMMFGGELSGHVYFRDKFPGFDSGLYAGLRLLEILSHTDKTVSQLLDGVNQYYSTEELKFASRDDCKVKVIDKVKDYCNSKKYKMLTIDGIRVQFEDGWALVRMSNTGPNITARFEATTSKRLEEIKKEFTSLIENTIEQIYHN